eukprot:gnl/TRDRNA2_/TRDRNA2_64110_c0_seq1.p1 gnl/TRDRNA2_/TRDRNA2_64110_c0~~gnl/TRDRNA2_/TRDRNA2_64110_c0_seq1.p1  ORF type:complete len:122 (+),score=17.97 gnl/TRDRNA2_/TRDRNA2_64110_c0_seq1:132-497(+)
MSHDFAVLKVSYAKHSIALAPIKMSLEGPASLLEYIQQNAMTVDITKNSEPCMFFDTDNRRGDKREPLKCISGEQTPTMSRALRVFEVLKKMQSQGYVLQHQSVSGGNEPYETYIFSNATR